VRPVGQAEFGTRCEIKNLNSFRFMQQAIEFEARRQIELIEDGGTVVQETRLYDPDRDETRSMRSKEDAMDYRYFPDPDLLPLEIAPQWIERVRGELPELPGAMRERFVRDYGLREYDAQALTASNSLAKYFENVAGAVADRKVAANWVMGELSAALNESGLAIESAPVSPTQLAGLIERVLDGTINNKTAKDVFAALWAGEGPDADTVIEARGLKQISDLGAIEKIVDEVLAANAKSVEEFRAGKEKAFNALVGQAMKATKGKANPAQVNEILRRKLAG
jgi:aspartyl-tRNA(Asn)/glutamyl-tRNA(Gln) amidotransferase subunit B